MCGISYMFRHYIAIVRERSECLVWGGGVWGGGADIVVGRVGSSDVVLGDRIPKIYYRLLFN
jgi:hypothetical protein